VIGREAFGLARLAAIEKLHQRAAEVLRSDNRAESRACRQPTAQARASEPATGTAPAPRW